MTIALVVDSTCDFSAEYYRAHDVTMVPLSVRFGDQVQRDWVDITPDQFFGRMIAGEVPKTSQPTAGEFAEAYKGLAEAGYDEIVSIHISSGLSGTMGSATVGAKDCPIPVRLIDTLNASMGLGLVLDRAIEARDRGAGVDEIESICLEMRPRVRDLYCVDTLKWLEIGGRIGKASAMLGTMLNIKPILTVTDGIVAPYKKAKGTSRAIEEIVDCLASEGAGTPVRACPLYANDREPMVRMKAALAAKGVELDIRHEGQIGCVIGTYLGPGAFGIIFERHDI